MTLFLSFLPYLLVALGVIVMLTILASGYVKAPSDKAYVITGPRSTPKIFIGKAGIKIPFIDRLDTLDLSLIPIDVRTANYVPTTDYIDVKVNATVNVKISATEEGLGLAATHFLNKNGSEVGDIVRETLEASVREIIGDMRLEDMVTNRQAFTEKVMETAVPDLAKLGLEIVSFNVQDFIDKNGVIENLGVDNVVRIQKKAAISRAESEKEIAVAKAKAAQEANDANAAAQEEIAKRNAQLENEQARLKKEVDVQKAQADAAHSIETENQRKLRDVAATNAEIAKAEREAELKQKQIELKEYELTALVRKQADAEKYAAEKKAESILIARQKEAEAKRYEQEQKAAAEKFAAEQEAEAMKAKADAQKYAALAEAEGIAAVGKADAEAIQAKALAEAEGIDKKAEAQKKMGQASVIEMTMEALPKIAANVAAPLTNVDKITMYGGDGSTKLVGDVITNTTQVIDGLKEATGLDVSSLLAGYLGGKLAD